MSVGLTVCISVCLSLLLSACLSIGINAPNSEIMCARENFVKTLVSTSMPCSLEINFATPSFASLNLLNFNYLRYFKAKMFISAVQQNDS